MNAEAGTPGQSRSWSWSCSVSTRTPNQLAVRFMSFFGAAFLAAWLVIATVTLVLLYTNEQRTWQGRQLDAAQNIATSVGAVIQRAERTLTLTATWGRDDLVSEPKRIATVLETDPNILEVVYLDAHGGVLAEADRVNPVLANLFTIGQSRWFLQAHSGQPEISSVWLSAQGSPYLILAYPGPAGEVIAARLDLTPLWSAVAAESAGDQGSAFIVNGEGDIVAHSDSSVVLAATNVSAWPDWQQISQRTSEAWQGDFLDLTGVPVVGATAPVPGTDWLVVSELPQSSVYAGSWAAVWILAGLLVSVGVGLNTFVGLLIQRLVRDPLDHLRAGADRVSQGELDHRVRIIRRDEIGIVAEAFNGMIAHLAEWQLELAQRANALRESEARYRAIVEDQTELVCRWQPNGRLTFVNEAYCRYFQRTREALIGDRFVTHLPPEDAEALAEHIACLNLDHPVVTLEHRVRFGDGGQHWHQWTHRVLFDPDGRIVEYASVGRDVTARKLAEARLRETEQYYRTLFEEAPMMYIVTRAEAAGPRIVDCNRQFLEVLGFQESEVLGHALADFYTEESRRLLDAGGYTAALTAPLASQERHLRTRAGHVLQTLLWAMPELDDTGQPIGTRALFVDISARARAEAALRESEERLKLALEIGQAGAWELDLTSGALVWSAETFRLMGCEPGAVKPTIDLWLQTVHPDDMPALVTELEKHRDFDLTFRVVWPDSSQRWIRAVARALVDADEIPRALVGLQQDITDRKLAEATLRKSELRHRRLALELRELNGQLEQRVQERTQALSETNQALSQSEERLRRITDNMRDMVVQVDTLGRYEYVSPSHDAVLGYRPADLLGHTLFDGLHPDDVEQVRSMADRIVSGGAPFRIEVRYRHAQGHFLWLEAIGNPLCDESGRVIGALIGSRDVTARKSAEKRATLFSNLGYRLSSAQSMEAASDVILAAADELFGWDVAFLDLYDEKRDVMQSVLFIDTLDDGRRVASTTENPTYPPTDTTRRVMAEGQFLILRSGPEPLIPGLVYWGDSSNTPGSLMFVAIRNGGQFVGLLSIQSYRDQAYRDDDLGALQALADHCGGTLERLRTAAHVRASLSEKVVMLQEIHHRVKNNLQVVNSLLSLQSRVVADPTALEVLRDSQNRVRSMALVHERLYRSDDLAHVDLLEYARGLVEQLWRTYAAIANRVTLAVNGEPCQVGVDVSIACGLILNELVTNALKHAFPNEREGRVTIEIRAAGPERAWLSVADDGVGLPPDIDPGSAATLGLQLVDSLVGQIDGVLKVQGSAGTLIRIEFPITSPEAGS